MGKKARPMPKGREEGDWPPTTAKTRIVEEISLKSFPGLVIPQRQSVFEGIDQEFTP
jgi:hypothetical protein